jgi:murein DD-endopeptidase MepM/ murein hydrolase activator NlpD
MLALDLSDIFAWDIDFATDIRKGDTFKVVVEGLYLNGEFRKYGRILSAEIVNKGEPYHAYRFEDEEGADYYDAAGRSLKKAFLKAPLSFRRISSNFSRGRYHPILKITRPHHGSTTQRFRALLFRRQGWNGRFCRKRDSTAIS